MKKLTAVLTELFLFILFLFNNSDGLAGEKGTQKYFYIGTYTDKSGEGIYRAALDVQTGKLSDLKLIIKSDNPSFIALNKDEHYLIAINETINSNGDKAGFIESFAVSPENGQLTRVSKISSGGAHPCYVSVNDDGYVLSANYTGGSVALIGMDKSGKLSLADVKQHSGSGPYKGRQEGPHVHSAFYEKGSDRIFVADLGIDAVKVYNLDRSKPRLVTSVYPEIKLKPGSGPRHLAFHPKKKILYVANELSNSVSVFLLKKDGNYSEIETVSSLPAGFDKPNTVADIHITDDGRFLYVSNRGLNSIAIFAVNPVDGKLNQIGQESTRGANPRNFTLSPDNEYLLAANQTTENIVAFRRDKKTGKLIYTDQIKAFQPVCLLFEK